MTHEGAAEITRRLQAGEDPGDLVQDAGYSSRRAFDRAYKAATGRTPAQVARGQRRPQVGRPPVEESGTSPQVAFRLPEPWAGRLEREAERRGVSRHVAARDLIVALLQGRRPANS